MASSKEYLDFILGQLSELDDIAYRAMMGEFIIYYKGKIVGGIYDDRLLVKPIKSAIEYMPTATYELPYEGAKEMLLVDEVDEKEYSRIYDGESTDRYFKMSGVWCRNGYIKDNVYTKRWIQT